MKNRDVFFEKPPERELDVALGFGYLNDCINRLGLGLHLEEYGSRRFPIYKAYIFDKLRYQKWIGGGKGFQLQGKVSAIAECLQHYLVFNTVLNYTADDLKILSGKELLSIYEIGKFKKYDVFLGKYHQEKFESLAFRDVFDAKKVIYYPLSLTEPRYDKLNKKSSHSLAWRAHDTGSSLGFSRQEALLHGINEWIEIHSLSMFMISNFFSKKKIVRCIDKRSLPCHIRELITHIETSFNDTLSIIHLNNEFGIPCILTHFNYQPECIVQPKGFACSLNKEYAVEKSIFEALQCRLLRNENTKKREKSIYQNFARYPIFLDAYRFITMEGEQEVVLYENISNHDDANIDNQISIISKLLEQHGGHKIFYHHYQHDDSQIHSIQVFIPGLNESFLIKEGKFIYENIIGS